MTAETPNEKMWLPLESNPIVMTTYLEELGAVKGSFGVADVYGLDDDLLAMVPSKEKVVAVLMLFPLTDRLEKAVSERDAALRVAAGLPPVPATSDCAAPFPIPNDLLFMTQVIGNACGTIGLLHALGNNARSTTQPRIGLAKGCFIESFLAEVKAKEMDACAIGNYLNKCDLLDSLHLTAAVNGQSELPSEEKEEDDPHNRIYHFVAFVAKDGYLWELDGRRNYPHRSEPCSEGDMGMPLLKAAATAIEWYMAQDPDNIQFGLTALVAGEMEDTD